MSTYLKSVMSTKVTPQTEAIPGKNQVKNNAGGFVFALDNFARLNRFLILGSETGSYYVSEKKLTKDNADSVLAAIQEDGLRVVRTVIEISDAGRAPKNGPALFVLALCSAFGNDATKSAAYAALPLVARTGTHLFEYAGYVDGMRGWGKGLRKAISNWYLSKNEATLALHAVKYRQREGWSHADLLRLSHAQAAEQRQGRASATRNTIFSYMVDGWPSVGKVPHDNEALQIIWAAETAKDCSEKELINLITTYRLPMECVPTEKRTRAVYEAMIPTFGITALIRNLGNLSKCGAISKGNFSSLDAVTSRITNADLLKMGRVHPLQVLVALHTFKQGHGEKGNSTWPVIQDVVDALDSAFYTAFGAVEPSGKDFLLAIDVSGSMAWETSKIAGLSGITCREAAAAMAMVTYKTERHAHIMAFSSNNGWNTRINSGLHEVNLGRLARLDQVANEINAIPPGGTDCSLPMEYAIQNNLKINTFVVYTDSETYAGRRHPIQALQAYREHSGIDAKLIVCGMVSNGFTIADPKDRGSLDIVGFDTSAPNVITAFSAGQM